MQQRPQQRDERLAWIAVAVASSAVHLGTLRAALVWDDLEFLPRQALIRAPGRLLAIFTSPYWGPEDYLYRPLTLLTFALNHGHLLNLLLHAAVGCGLCALLRRLPLEPWPCLAAALLFAVHPIHTEAVAQIVGRADLLAAGFGLLFLVLHLRRGSPATAAASFLLALWSKESAIAFLALAVWTDLCFPRAGSRFWKAGFAGYAAVTALWLALRAAAIDAEPAGIPFLDNPVAGAAAWIRVLTATRVQLDYFVLQILPLGLSADYSFRQIPPVASPLEPRALAALATGALAVAGAWAAWARHRVLAWAVGGYALLFLPTSNLLFPIGTIMGERLAYAPSLLFAAAVGFGAGLARARFGRSVTALVGLAILALGALSIARNEVWIEPGAFARALVRSAPESAKAHFTLALELQREGAFDESRASLERAIAIHPGYAEAWSRLGLAHLRREDPTAAIAAYERAVAIFPGFTEAQYGLAYALQQVDRLDEAAASYRAALELDPRLVEAHVNLGTIAARRGRLDEAEAHWRRALEIDPGHESARENLDRLHELRARQPL